MQQTIDQFLHEATSYYLQSLGFDNLSGAETITSELYERSVNTIDAINAVCGKGRTWLSMMSVNTRGTAASGMPALMTSAR